MHLLRGSYSAKPLIFAVCVHAPQGVKVNPPSYMVVSEKIDMWVYFETWNVRRVKTLMKQILKDMTAL